ncbi:MAG: hypothetical protein CL920_08160 [Deltaproteobacteria bacterium]|nr:hypothetical protein [Deltaproteobacteria bacterium]MBU48653.1 hypothetical protein [Deltaproteobacteria bacterium]
MTIRPLRKDRLMNLSNNFKASQRVSVGIVCLLLCIFACPSNAAVVPPLLCKHQVGDQKLHHNIILPHHRGGDFTGIVIRTPTPDGYAKLDNQRLALAANSLTSVIVQYTRGNKPSEGEYDLLGSLKENTTPFLDYLKQHVWYNGQLFSLGEFLQGTASFLTAETVPCLGGQMVWFASPKMYPVMFQNGVFRKQLAQFAMNRQDLKPLEGVSDISLSNSTFWAKRSAMNPEKVSAPTVFVAGWFSPMVQQMLDAYQDYTQKSDEKTRPWHKIIIGPWQYGATNAERINTTQQGELNFPDNMTKIYSKSIEDFMLDWVESRVLYRSDTFDKLFYPVTYYLMGPGSQNKVGNRWYQSNTWPPPSTPTKMFLHKDGNISKDAPTEADASKTYDYDPKDPAPSIGGRHVVLKTGPRDQAELEKRKDVLVFTTAALTEPLYVVGKVRATLWVSSDAKDTDFSVKLTDVYPDGSSIALLDGIMRLRHHKSTEKEDFVTPNTPVEIELDMSSTAMVFDKGHKLRIIISSSDSPAFLPNPNTGAAFSFTPENPVVAKNTVYFAKDKPSFITLPVVASDFYTSYKRDDKLPTPSWKPGGKTDQCRLPKEGTTGPCLYEADYREFEAEPNQDAGAETIEVPEKTQQETERDKAACACDGTDPVSWSVFALLILLGLPRKRKEEK